MQQFVRSSYYPWCLLCLASFGVLMSVPGQTVGVSVFTESLLSILPLSRTALSTAYMLGTICSALVLGHGGRLYDRYGPRSLTPLIACCLAGTLLYFSLLGSLLSVTRGAPEAVYRSLAFIIVTLGFIALRFFGQGMMTLTNRNIAMKWFERRRGLASGIMSIVVSAGFSSAAVIINGLIERFSWSGAWQCIALFLVMVFAPLSYIFYRDSPASEGVHPDGHLPDSDTPHVESGVGLEDAKTQPIFWVALSTLSLSALLMTAISFHIVAIFVESGRLADTAIQSYLYIACASVGTTLVLSVVSDRLPLYYCMSLHAFSLIGACTGLYFLHTPIGFVLFVLGMGVSQGIHGILGALVWPYYFGTRFLGAITGYTMALMVFASALGPVLYGSLQEYSGHFALPALVSIATAAIVFLLSFRIWTQKPVRFQLHISN